MSVIDLAPERCDLPIRQGVPVVVVHPDVVVVVPDRDPRDPVRPSLRIHPPGLERCAGLIAEELIDLEVVAPMPGVGVAEPRTHLHVDRNLALDQFDAAFDVTTEPRTVVPARIGLVAVGEDRAGRTK